MKLPVILALIMAIALLFSGCTSGNAPTQPSVTTLPKWEQQDTKPSEVTDYTVHLYYDLTQSMYGFAGFPESPISKVTKELTDSVRLLPNFSSYALVNTDNILQWSAYDPLLIADGILNKNIARYTLQGDFQEGLGGPLAGVFSEDIDPTQVKILVTDLLEQESAVEILPQYAKELFQSPSHEQLRIYVADSPFDGYVSFPIISGNKFSMTNKKFTGDRPFAIVVAGPAAGVEEIHKVLDKTGVRFAHFMVENKRVPSSPLAFTPGQTLSQSLLLDKPKDAHCILNLSPLTLEDTPSQDCLLFSYEKTLSNKDNFARLSFLGETEKGAAITLEKVYWQEWVSQTGEDGSTTYSWKSCTQPSGATLELSTLEEGSPVAERDASQTGLDDFVINSGHDLHEFSLYLDSTTTDKVYAVQAHITAPSVTNPLSSTKAFEPWDIHFTEFSRATDNSGELKHIPDLLLLLQELAKLDAKPKNEVISDIKFVVQTYPYSAPVPEPPASTPETNPSEPTAPVHK